MPDQEPPQGAYFSITYLTPTEPQDDSQRFRNRLAAYCSQEYGTDFLTVVAQTIQRDLGVNVKSRAYTGYDFQDFFNNAELRDVLGGITAVYRTLWREGAAGEQAWQQFVQTAMDEGNLNYRIDDEGGVHYRVDEEFERGRATIISILGDAKYAAVAAEVGRAYDRLTENPPATNEAIRSVFLALETLTKLMATKTKVARLNANAIDKGLLPIVESTYAADASERKAAVALLSGLKNWVTAGHEYRHGQERENPREAPLEFAVAMLSSGASYLRWLAEIDRQRSG